ncbi:hypothetical protein ACFSX9_11535 [Flavobacterium ardleyense]|uniref:YhhN-like protein n=1 Tax=Flavobacterium ardleyense TaxID=2038737 RepID=A0ABW5Z904_9FLAO
MSEKKGNLNPALVLFFSALALYLISLFLDSPHLELFCRPVIIPAIFYYYYTSVKGRINLLFSLTILSYFTAEILFLISDVEFLIPRLLFNLMPYFVITHFLVQDYFYYLKKKKYKTINLFFYLILIFLVYILFSVLSLTLESSQIIFAIYIAFAVLLLAISFVCFLILFAFNNKTILYMVLMVISFLISDLFFIFATQMTDIFALKFIFLASKQVSFFLYTSYFIKRTKYQLWKVTI